MLHLGRAFGRVAASTDLNALGSLLVLVAGCLRLWLSWLRAFLGSNIGCGLDISRFKCQWGWKCSSNKAPPSSLNLFKVWTHGSLKEDVKVML